jgi:hypothetical protein
MTQASLTREQLEVLLEIRDPTTWDVPVAAWDEAVWDGDPPGNEWTDARAGYVDVTCDVRGFVIERGRQSNWDNLLAANLDLELDNSSGLYSIYASDAYPRIRPGFAIEITAKWKGQRYPLFVGTVNQYTEGQTPGDYKVALKCTDAFYGLAVDIGGQYNPGTPYQPVTERINGLLDRGRFDGPRHLVQGNATMLNYATSRSVLDEIQLTAVSDGGVFFIDTDGTAMFMGQERVNGRPRPDGAQVPSFSDDCVSGLPYAAIEPIIADHEFGNVVLVSNVSQGTDSPTSAYAIDQDSVIANGEFPWSPDQLVLCNANYVQALADFQLSRRSQAFYRINSFECYPIHDDELWDALLPLRIMDSLFITRTPPASNIVHAPQICDGIRIEATPEMWKYVVRCSPGDKIDIANFWDFDYWDSGVWV